MLFRETVAIYCEDQTEHTNTLCGQNAVSSSQETRYVSATEPNRLKLFRETAAVYCENQTEHTDTLCGQNAVSSSQETHYVSATEPNRLKQSLSIVRTIRNTQIHSVGKMQSVAHRKRMKSPPQSPTG
jgi:hypothetical protein